ncbi:hypothetical protein ACFY4C_03965 [Actinomadura viridis]|uniref:hypothetical protein n=1 Tax=Actinomadura viridis TaxID=58110 RepID=UPI0036BA3952
MSANPDRGTELLETIGAGGRPLLLSGGAVVSLNPLMGDWEKADVPVGGSMIVGVGPGLLSAAEDDGMIVIDCTGCLVLPSRADFVSPGSGGALTPGEAADIAVIRLADREGAPDGAVIGRAGHLDILLADGTVTVWDGGLADPGRSRPAAQPSGTSEHPYVGLWVDELHHAGYRFTRR